MARKPKFTIHGMPAMKRALARLDRAGGNKVRKAIEQSTKDMADDMRAAAPERRGILKGDIQGKVDPNELSGRAGVLEEDRESSDYVASAEFGNYKQGAQPFIFPAGQKVRPVHARRVRQAIIDSVNRT